jgi:hypothetical protein
MTFSVWIPVPAVFLSGVVTGIFVILVIGICIGSHARHLTDEPTAHTDAFTRRVLDVGVRITAWQEIAAPKENDQCTLLTTVITPCR